MDTITVLGGGIVAAPRRRRASTDKELPGSLQTHEDVCKQSNADIPAPTLQKRQEYLDCLWLHYAFVLLKLKHSI
jgi:hypothetical protein